VRKLYDTVGWRFTADIRYLDIQVLTINVKPGWKSGTKITFQREGDQAPNKIPADIVFIIRDKPHQHFRREGSDLRHVCKITLREVNTFYHVRGHNSEGFKSVTALLLCTVYSSYERDSDDLRS
jgi:hypothetical protein